MDPLPVLGSERAFGGSHRRPPYRDCVARHVEEADGGCGMITGQTVAACDERSTNGATTTPSGSPGGVGTSVRALRRGAAAAWRSWPRRADGHAARPAPW